jgi:hypothetical protein
LIPAVTDDLPELLAGLAFLLGTWRGVGRGTFPTIDGFDYGEELSFTYHGEPWLAVDQRAWSLDDEVTLHMERGFLRPVRGSTVELVLAHPIGVAEVAHGTLTGTTLEVSTDPGLAARSETGLEVSELRRRYEVVEDSMRYRIDMATAGTALTEHLSADLRRVT